MRRKPGGSDRVVWDMVSWEPVGLSVEAAYKAAECGKGYPHEICLQSLGTEVSNVPEFQTKRKKSTLLLPTLIYNFYDEVQKTVRYKIPFLQNINKCTPIPD
jgi:hypothetical protein